MCARTDQKLERLKTLGLDHGINYATDSFVERTNQLTDSRGVDIVVDSIGGQNLIDSVGVLAYRGTLVSVGLAARAGSMIEARSLWTRNNSLRGVWLAAALPYEHARIHAMTGDLLEQVARRELRVEIDRSFPLAEAAAAHEYVESRKAFGRVVITPCAHVPANSRSGPRRATVRGGTMPPGDVRLTFSRSELRILGARWGVRGAARRVSRPGARWPAVAAAR